MKILDERDNLPKMEFKDIRCGDVFESDDGFILMKTSISLQGNAIEIKNGICNRRFEEDDLVTPLNTVLLIKRDFTEPGSENL